MIIKTDSLRRKLDSDIKVLKFGRGYYNLAQKGSFKYLPLNTEISDIDYEARVPFVKGFIDDLKNIITRIRGSPFTFTYLNAGTYKEFEDSKPPWNIFPRDRHRREDKKYFKLSPNNLCDFDLLEARNWFRNFREQKLFEKFKTRGLNPSEDYKEISDILNGDAIRLADLIKIESIIEEYSTIRWFYADVMREFKKVGKYSYNLLEQIKKDPSPVAQYVYLFLDRGIPKAIEIDVGLVSTIKKAYKPSQQALYRYYKGDWYKILKSYKGPINRKYEKEYKSFISTLAPINSMLARIVMLQRVQKYGNIPVGYAIKIRKDLQEDLKKYFPDIGDTKMSIIEYKLRNLLNKKAESKVYYFYDRLWKDEAKMSYYKKIRLVNLAGKYTDSKTLIRRRENGVQCPFFESGLEEYMKVLAERSKISGKLFKKCFTKLAKEQKLLVFNFVKKYFDGLPVTRIFLEKRGDNHALRGVFSREDRDFAKDHGENRGSEYIISPKYKRRVQIYLLSGK